MLSFCVCEAVGSGPWSAPPERHVYWGAGRLLRGLGPGRSASRYGPSTTAVGRSSAASGCSLPHTASTTGCLNTREYNVDTWPVWLTCTQSHMDVTLANVAPIGLWNVVLRPPVYILAVAILELWLEVTIYGREGWGERTLSYQLMLVNIFSYYLF